MVRRLGSLLVVLGALALPAVASAAYPAPFAVQGGQGLSSLDGTVRYVAQPFGANTRIDALGAEAVARSVVLRGDYGIATLTQNGVTGGLFHWLIGHQLVPTLGGMSLTATVRALLAVLG